MLVSECQGWQHLALVAGLSQTGQRSGSFLTIWQLADRGTSLGLLPCICHDVNATSAGIFSINRLGTRKCSVFPDDYIGVGDRFPILPYNTGYLGLGLLRDSPYPGCIEVRLEDAIVAFSSFSAMSSLKGVDSPCVRMAYLLLSSASLLCLLVVICEEEKQEKEKEKAISLSQYEAAIRPPFGCFNCFATNCDCHSSGTFGSARGSSVETPAARA